MNIPVQQELCSLAQFKDMRVTSAAHPLWQLDHLLLR